jgi:hypothetical protein
MLALGCVRANDGRGNGVIRALYAILIRHRSHLYLLKERPAGITNSSPALLEPELAVQIFHPVRAVCN